MFYIANAFQTQHRRLLSNQLDFLLCLVAIDFSYRSSSPKARALAQMNLNDILLYIEIKRFYKTSPLVVLDGHTVIILIERVRWDDLGRSHSCKGKLPHGMALLSSARCLHSLMVCILSSANHGLEI